MNRGPGGVAVQFAALLLAYLALTPPSHAHVPSAQGGEVRTATAFLFALEGGRTDEAFAMLSPESQLSFGRRALDPGTLLGRRGGYARRFVSTRPAPQGLLGVFGLRQPSARYRYHLICFVESPAQGFGIVRYIAVIVGQGAGGPRYFVMSYRIESSLSNCA